MKSQKSRREFLKFGAVASIGIVAILKGKKVNAKVIEPQSDSEILYRETEHFKKYYESLRS